MIRQPDAPIGWPRAIAPPLMLTCGGKQENTFAFVSCKMEREKLEDMIVFIFGGTKLQVTVTENVNNFLMACYAREPLWLLSLITYYCSLST